MKFYLSMFYLIILKTNVESVILDIKPRTIIQAEDPSLTINCQPSPDDEVATINRLIIGWTDKTMGFVSKGKSPELGPAFESPKYTLTGSIQDSNSVSTAFVQIVIKEPNSNDTGEYLCRVGGQTSSGDYVNPEKRTNVTFQALSDTSSMSTTTSSVDRSGCAKQFRVTDTTTVTVLGVLVALYCCFFI